MWFLFPFSHSVLQPDQDKTSWSWERTSPQSNSKQPGQTEIKGAGELTRLRSSSPEPSNYDLTRTIRAEVERLMQGQNEPLRDRQSDKAKKQQVRQNLKLFSRKKMYNLASVLPSDQWWSFERMYTYLQYVACSIFPSQTFRFDTHNYLGVKLVPLLSLFLRLNMTRALMFHLQIHVPHF